MQTQRLEAFSDGVLAIIITIMVLELKAPENYHLDTLLELAPVFFAYLISFIYIGCYWNHHHHLFHLLERVNGKMLWANLHFLFWLSLIPVATDWVGETHEAPIPMAFYGLVLLLSFFAFVLLRTLGLRHSKVTETQALLVNDKAQLGKFYLSISLYLLGIACAFGYWPISVLCFFSVVLLWFVPSKHIEAMHQNPPPKP